MKLNIKTKKLSDLKPAKYNPRVISDQAFAGLERSMDKYGIVEPIIWNKRSGNVVGGHQRLEVLKKKKLKDTDVVVVDLDDKDEKMLNLSLNNQLITGTYVPEKLELLLTELKDLPEYTDLRFDELEIIVLGGNEKEEDIKEKEIDENIKTKNKCPKCDYEW